MPEGQGSAPGQGVLPGRCLAFAWLTSPGSSRDEGSGERLPGFLPGPASYIPVPLFPCLPEGFRTGLPQDVGVSFQVHEIRRC